MRHLLDEVVISRVSGILGVASLVMTICSWASGTLLDPVARLLLWIVSALFLFIASILESSSSPVLDANGNPIRQRRLNPKWTVPLIVLILVATVDGSFYLLGYLKPIEHQIVQESFTHTDTIHRTIAFIEAREGVTINCSTQWKTHAPLVDELELVVNESQPVLDRPLTVDDAASYYNMPFAHFSFDVTKGPRVDQVTIEEVVIEVVDFKPLPVFEQEGSAEGMGESTERILLFELSPPDCKSLPQQFSPTWYLADINGKKVLKWNVVNRPCLRMDDALTFHVRLFSQAPGLYQIRAHMKVRAPFARPRRVELIESARWLAFTDVQTVARISDSLLRRYGYARESRERVRVNSEGKEEHFTEEALVPASDNDMQSAPPAPDAPAAPTTLPVDPLPASSSKQL